MLLKKLRMLNGYRVIYLPAHPRAMKGGNWDGYVYEHIVVAEKSLNKALRPDEIVHHLDGERANNRSSNLLILNRGQHAKLHKWLAAGAPGLERTRENGVNSGKPKATKEQYCLVCNLTLQLKQKKFCSVDCESFGTRKTPRPSKEELEIDMKSMSFLAMGRKYNVSDNAVRKWARKYGLLRQS